MNTQTKHEESGCTDYLQHTWESCPENKAQGKPELLTSEAEYQAAVHEWNYGKPQAQHSPLPWHIEGDGICSECYAIAYVNENKNKKADMKLIVASVNHAAKLAEALRELLKLVNHNEPAWNRAFDALGNWEGAK